VPAVPSGKVRTQLLLKSLGQFNTYEMMGLRGFHQAIVWKGE
jgi:hypothetical protein